MMKTPEEYFKKWSENCRLFQNYKPIHSHEDMMRFAKDYHNEQSKSFCKKYEPFNNMICKNCGTNH